MNTQEVDPEVIEAKKRHAEAREACDAAGQRTRKAFSDTTYGTAAERKASRAIYAALREEESVLWQARQAALYAVKEAYTRQGQRRLSGLEAKVPQ